jgi:hypothetical protein
MMRSRNEKSEGEARLGREGPSNRPGPGRSALGSRPQWTGCGPSIACVAAALASFACPTHDGMDSGADGTGGPVQNPHGHFVSCCYAGGFDTLSASTQGYFCLGSIPRPCIDEGEYATDEDLVEFCDMKCAPPWAASTVVPPPGQYYDESFDLIGGNGGVTWLDSCYALPVASEIHSTIVQPNACTPTDPVPFGEGTDVPPTHVGSFTDRDGSMEIDIVGATLTAKYELSVQFALDDCQSGGIDGGTCTLVMSGFDMTLHDIEMSGGDVDYQVTASLSLNQTAVAEVFFDECGLSTCEGSFELSEAEGNPIGVDLEWTQVDPTTMSTGHGALYLANDGVALGGVDALYGYIELDRKGRVGIIQLFGSGADSFGGDFAAVDFAMHGFVETIDTERGDCCETRETGGCSNDDIKACVATRIPSFRPPR